MERPAPLGLPAQDLLLGALEGFHVGLGGRILKQPLKTLAGEEAAGTQVHQLQVGAALEEGQRLVSQTVTPCEVEVSEAVPQRRGDCGQYVDPVITDLDAVTKIQPVETRSVAKQQTQDGVPHIQTAQAQLREGGQPAPGVRHNCLAVGGGR